jgi:hypothetical protein
MKRPGRPFGVSIAIAAGTFLFALLPLLQVGMVLGLRQHYLNISVGDEAGLSASGADFTAGVSSEQLLLQSVLALAFLAVAVLTWRGRPSRMRYIFVGAVVLLTLIKFAAVIIQSQTKRDLQAGLSSGDDLSRSLAVGQLVVEIVVTLYVVWYMNRGPARAFFRGYYLPTPSETPEPQPEMPRTER